MSALPSLPPEGPIRTIAVLASLALLAWTASGVVHAVRRKRRELAWDCALVALGVLTGILGAGRPQWHVVLAGLTAGVALRSLVLSQGAARACIGAGLAFWLATVVQARLTFG